MYNNVITDKWIQVEMVRCGTKAHLFIYSDISNVIQTSNIKSVCFHVPGNIYNVGFMCRVSGLQFDIKQCPKKMKNV